MNFPLKIRIIMSGRPQIEIAKRARMSDSKLSKIIKGWEKPRREDMERIAKSLNCEVQELFPDIPNDVEGKGQAGLKENLLAG